jgi:hypothetical protein
MLGVLLTVCLQRRELRYEILRQRGESDRVNRCGNYLRCMTVAVHLMLKVRNAVPSAVQMT